MKKVSLLAASVALALTGCGGSDGGSDSNKSNDSNIVITAIDGYLQNAEIWVDQDGNLINGCEFNTEKLTNANGQATISKSDYAGMDVCIKAIAGQTIDKDRGIVTSGFELASPSSEDDHVVVNPMTNMVIQKVKAQLASDPDLDVAEAKKTAANEVVTAVTTSGLTASAEMIFGDYIASTATSNDAKALKVIGETLVDNKDQAVDKQLEITNAVAEKAQEIIASAAPEDIDNFAPVVTVPDDGIITVEQNSRPVVSTSPESVTIQLGDALQQINVAAYFSDAEGDTLTFTMLAIGGDKNGIDIDNSGMITGTPVVAGEFTYQIFAEDTKGSLSYPATLTVTIESPNTAPVVNDVAKADLQAQVSGWQWVKGEQPLDTLNISALFTDVDSDVLTYKVETSLSKNGGADTGFQVYVDGSGTITFDGPVPFVANAGSEHIYVYANDGVNAEEALATFALPQIAEGTEPEQPATPTGFTLDHFDGRIWKMGSFAQEDGEIGYAMLMQGTAGLEFCWGTGDEMNQEYKANISDWNNAYTILETLDTATGYASAENKDCWDVTLQQDGTLLSNEGSKYQVLYQNVTADNHYQILMAVGSQELFWLDSADIPFAQTMPISEKVSDGVVEYDMTVEASEQFYEELDGPELGYSAGKLTYATGTYVFDSILPTGFTTPGNYSIEEDSLTGMEQLILEETGEMSDYKTRYRYVNRDFGDFYIGIKWYEEQNFASRKEYGLYTQNEQLMRNLLANLPILQD